MRIIKPYKLAASLETMARDGHQWLCVSSMFGFPLEVGPKMVPAHRLLEVVHATLRPGSHFDPGIPKERPEVLVTADAYAPPGKPVERLQALVRLSGDDVLCESTIEVIGDRHWLDETTHSAPEPFLRMPLSWQRAFGGRDHPDNPLGRGDQPLPLDLVQAGQPTWPLPNLERPQQLIRRQGDTPTPIGWDVRPYADLPVGEASIQLAAAELQLHEPLRGNEFVRLDYLHPEQTHIHWRLPGIRVRVWHHRQGEIRELASNLDTIWLFPNALLGVAIFRAVMPVAEQSHDDNELLILGAEQLSEDKPLFHYLDIATAQLADGEAPSAPHAALLPASEYRRDEEEEARQHSRAPSDPGPNSDIAPREPATQRQPTEPHATLPSPESGRPLELTTLIPGTGELAVPAPRYRRQQDPDHARPSTREFADSDSPPRFALDAGALPAHAQLLAFEGHEALSQPYRFSVDLAIHDPASFELTSIVGQPARLHARLAQGQPPYQWHGIISQAEHRYQQGHTALFRMQLVPALARLDLVTRTRMFLDLNIVQIIDHIFGEHRLKPERDYRLAADGEFPAYQQCCQLEETDLAFVSRLLARARLYFFFEQTRERERVVICDATHAHHPLSHRPALFRPQHDLGNALHQLDSRCALLAASRPSLAAAAQPITIAQPKLAKLRRTTPVSASANSGLSYAQLAGHGRLFQLRPGYLLSVSDHPWPPLNASYLLTSLTHHGNQAAPYPQLAAHLELPHPAPYRVAFEAIPDGAAFTPAAEAEPVAPSSPVPATLRSSPPSAHSEPDARGRYPVDIFFPSADRGLKVEPVHALAPLYEPLGPTADVPPATFPAGTPVLVSFLNADPDRPVITAVLAPTPSADE